MIVAYITDSSLTVLTGTTGLPAQIQSVVKLEGLRGCMRSGVVVDSSTFRTVVGGFWEENQLPKNSVEVVLDSPHFLTRNVQAPLFKRKADLEAFLSRELESVGRIDTPLFSYRVDGPGEQPNTQALAVTVVESAVVERLLEAFGCLGVEVSAVISAGNAQAGALLEAAKRFGEGDAVLGLLVGDNLAQAVMVAQGEFRYSTEQNIFNERGSAGFFNEVARMVQGIDQYTAAERHEGFEEICLVASDMETAQRCSDAIVSLGIAADIALVSRDQLLKLPASVSKEDIGDIFPAACGLIAPSEGEVLVSALLGKGEKDSLGRSAFLEALRPYAAPLIALALCVVATASLGLANAGSANKVDVLSAQLASAEVQQALAEREAAQEAADAASEELASAQALVEGLAQYPKLSASIDKRISRCANGLVSFSADSYDAQSGRYVITATSKNEKTINRFVRNLIDDNYFQVSYYGYAYQNDKSMWELSIELTLPAGEGE